MKVVLDTNVLVAAFAFGGICRAILEVCIDTQSLMLSGHILEETERNLVHKLKHPADIAHQRIELAADGADCCTPGFSR